MQYCAVSDMKAMCRQHNGNFSHMINFTFVLQVFYMYKI